MKKELTSVRYSVYAENFCEPDTYEFPTLDMVLGFARNNPRWKVLYVHTKGASMPDNECVADWRKSMAHFLVGRHEECVSKLDEYDTVGCNYADYHGFPHWQGNFWWATSDYIARLLPARQINFSREHGLWEDRHKAEAWIFLGKPKHFEIYAHKINPYTTRNVSYREK